MNTRGMIAGIAVAVVAIGATGVWYVAPVGASEHRAAITLSQTGPIGKAAYCTALADGKITRPEMQELRDASGRDIEKPGFFTSKPLTTPCPEQTR